MIYSTGGVERYIEHNNEIVTVPVEDTAIMKINDKNLKRAVSYRSVKMLQGDQVDELEDEK